MDKVKLIRDDGLRTDGRKADELRPLKIEANVLHRADGSAYVEWGYNKVLAAVYGPRETHPRYAQKMDRGIIQCRYNMAPFSVTERRRPGPDRRSIEISKVTAETFEKAVLTEKFPRASVDIYIEVLEANAGTRCAGIVAAAVALADAGVPMRDMVAACASGKIDGKIVVDLGKEEDNLGQADVPIAIMPRTGDILLLQMDGHLTAQEVEEALDMATVACKRIGALQREALMNRYSTKPEAVKEGVASMDSGAGPEGGEGNDK
jgi:exosome complex component RRP41